LLGSNLHFWQTLRIHINFGQILSGAAVVFREGDLENKKDEKRTEGKGD
jgi:hypothetical protein